MTFPPHISYLKTH